MPAATEPIVITDADDPRIADFRRLNDTAFRRSYEASGPFHTGLFVAEGWLAVERLQRSRYATRAVLVDAAKADRALALPLIPGVAVLVAERTVLDEIVGFPLHRGVVASAERGLPASPDTVARRARRLTVIEGIGDAENLGAIVRNAVALGGDGLLLDPTSCDPLTRRSIRVSVGHALTLPFARAPWPAILDDLRTDGVLTVALTPGCPGIDTVDLVAAADGLAPDRRVAIVVGAEGDGLTREAIEACEVAARIAMAPGVDSLNVAAAAAIAMHRLFGHPARTGSR